LSERIFRKEHYTQRDAWKSSKKQMAGGQVMMITNSGSVPVVEVWALDHHLVLGFVFLMEDEDW